MHDFSICPLCYKLLFRGDKRAVEEHQSSRLCRLRRPSTPSMTPSTLPPPPPQPQPPPQQQQYHTYAFN